MGTCLSKAEPESRTGRPANRSVSFVLPPAAPTMNPSRERNGTNNDEVRRGNAGAGSANPLTNEQRRHFGRSIDEDALFLVTELDGIDTSTAEDTSTTESTVGCKDLSSNASFRSSNSSIPAQFARQYGIKATPSVLQGGPKSAPSAPRHRSCSGLFRDQAKRSRIGPIVKRRGTSYDEQRLGRSLSFCEQREMTAMARRQRADRARVKFDDKGEGEQPFP